MSDKALDVMGILFLGSISFLFICAGIAILFGVLT